MHTHTHTHRNELTQVTHQSNADDYTKRSIAGTISETALSYSFTGIVDYVKSISLI